VTERPRQPLGEVGILSDTVPTVATTPGAMELLASQIQAALESADLNEYRELLDPAVTWGAFGDTESGCQNRQQVLTWYRQGRAKGVRARVTETVVGNDKILVGLAVSADEPLSASDPANRWQILTVKDGLIVDIRGFEDRATAVGRME
jgi:hypothetical protein